MAVSTYFELLTLHERSLVKIPLTSRGDLHEQISTVTKSSSGGGKAAGVTKVLSRGAGVPQVEVPGSHRPIDVMSRENALHVDGSSTRSLVGRAPGHSKFLAQPKLAEVAIML
jgi:hypothetical protein